MHSKHALPSLVCVVCAFVQWRLDRAVESLAELHSPDSTLCTQGSGLSFPLLALAVLYKLSHPSSVCSVPLCLFLRGESIYSAHFYLSGEANFLFSFRLLTSVILTPPLSTEGRLNPPQVSYLPTLLEI